MQTLLFMTLCALGYIIAYHTYGKFLAKRIFQIDESKLTPSHQFSDGIDFVPTRKSVIFGHHYTSIAGTGPIVGPAIGIIWGWLPAVIWVVFGNILMGAVHDFGALVLSLRNEGKGISDVAAKYINYRVRLILFFVIFLTLLIVIAVFGVIIANIFTLFPSSVLAVWLQIPISMILGRAIYKYNINLIAATAGAVVLMYLSIYLGSVYPITIPSVLGMPPSGVWVVILLIYAWIASCLPVTVLLQPRDFINAWQLFIAMGLLVISVVSFSFNEGLDLAAPAINSELPPNTPSIWPFMFVVIACGAISGFHALVSSGTTSKQLAHKKDVLYVGYGSMLLEGFLAVLVIICVTAGISIALKTDSGSMLSGTAAWKYQYATYLEQHGLSGKLAPVVLGAANLMSSIGIGFDFAVALMGVFIASFAGTTLDTSVRLQRYAISELSESLNLPKLASRHSATGIAVITAAVLAFATGAAGTGAMLLWPLFGSSNQLLAALTLLIITVYLKRKGGKKYFCTLLPCGFMLVTTIWALVVNEIEFYNSRNYLLTVMGALNLLLAIWMTVEAVFVVAKNRISEPALPLKD